MSAELTFRDVGYPVFFDHFSCEIQAGSSALIVTSGEAESNIFTRLFSALSTPSAGSISINSQDLATLDSEQIYDLRHRIGIVPAHGGLISNLKVWENITLPTVYHRGAVSPEEEAAASAYLEQLGYRGNLMALPAHLSLQEKRSVALVRTWLTQPDIVVYNHCYEDLPAQELATFSRLASEFHTTCSDRISLYLTSSADLAAKLKVDRILHLHKPAQAITRDI